MKKALAISAALKSSFDSLLGYAGVKLTIIPISPSCPNFLYSSMALAEANAIL